MTVLCSTQACSYRSIIQNEADKEYGKLSPQLIWSLVLFCFLLFFLSNSVILLVVLMDHFFSGLIYCLIYIHNLEKNEQYSSISMNCLNASLNNIYLTPSQSI